jgi:hypothetical protein
MLGGYTGAGSKGGIKKPTLRTAGGGYHCAMQRNEPTHAWFGASWGAPINEIQPHVETPVAEDCFFCHEPIAPNDQGYMMPFHDDGEGFKRVFAHKRCQHRSLGIKS